MSSSDGANTSLLEASGWCLIKGSTGIVETGVSGLHEVKSVV